MKKIVSLFLGVVIFAVSVVGCAEKEQNGRLVDDIRSTDSAVESDTTGTVDNSTATAKLHESTAAVNSSTAKPSPTSGVFDPQQDDKKVNPDDISAATNFAEQLFKKSLNPTKPDENTLISPFSVIAALSMITNGADGETLKQIEQTLGMSKDELNRFVYAYTNSLPENEKYKLSVANSIWINEYKNFKVNEDFEKKNKEYFDAELFTEPFNDDTVKKINEWVKNNTDEMIPKIMNDIRENDVMYLFNALAFDAEWKYPFELTQNGIFTCENGTEVGVDFMYSDGDKYIEVPDATGFIKYYKDNSYAFVALLPNAGVSVSQYVQTLNGDLSGIIAAASYKPVDIIVPKFEADYSTDLSDVLNSMGIYNAFDFSKADFSGAGKSSGGNLYIDKVIHKTYIEVNEYGTRAGAVTGIIMPDSAPMDPEEVRLDRPFIYMIIDCENNLPVFMGTMRDML